MPSEQQDISWVPAHVFGEERTSRWLVLCDHATNLVPPWLPSSTLGLPQEEMERHIAFDIGVAGVAVRLAEHLNAPVVLSNFSRLVIDPNRGEDDPTLVRRLYDETIIPGNRHLTETEIETRMALCYRPYHTMVERMAARRSDTVILSIHTFTPQLKHKQVRPWHIGLLFADDARLSLPLADLLAEDADVVVGLNEPYSGYLDGDTIDRHALRKGRQNTLIELRNDLVSDEAGQRAWAEKLAGVLPQALVQADRP
ncbi:MAG: N-formylglutamate amidohydrolase [Pseudomonadota bacterium]